MVYLGLDLGTSGVKAVVVNEAGAVISTAYREYSISLQSDARELSPEDIWQSTRHVIRAAAASAGCRPSALAVASFGEAVVAVDDRGEPLFPIMVSSDPRSDGIYARFSDRIDESYVARVCGLPLSSTYSFTKILFIQNHYPEIYHKTKYFLLVSDFICYKLSGVAASEYSVASRTMLFDVYNKKWDSNLLSLFGLEREKFAPPVRAGTCLGRIDARLAEELGVPADMKIVVGGHDQPCCAVGTGGLGTSAACSMGTSEAITPVLPAPLDYLTTLQYRFVTEPFLEEGRFCTMLFNPAAGLLVKWFFDTFCKDRFVNGVPPYQIFEAAAGASRTRLLALPFLCGRGTPEMNNFRRLSLHNIDPGNTLFDVYSALINGMCLEQRFNLELVERAGVAIDSLIVTGGASASEYWLRQKATILKRPIRVAGTREAVSVGCAALCAVALGEYSDLSEAAQNMCGIDRIIDPNTEDIAFYDDLYCEYIDVLKGEQFK